MRRNRPFKWTRLYLLAVYMVTFAVGVWGVTRMGNGWSWAALIVGLFSIAEWTFVTVLGVRGNRQRTETPPHD